MKRYDLYIITLIFGLFFLNACQDDSLVKKPGEVEEGIPVNVKLSFESFNLEEVKTKADLGTQVENTVKSIYLFIFNRNKELEHGHLYEISEVETLSKQIALSETITSGEKYIIAIANPSSGNVDIDNYQNVKTLEELKGIKLSVKGKQVQRPSALVMNGYWGETSESAKLNGGKCLIPPSVSTSNNNVTLDGKIYFEHLDGKIKFDVQLENPTNKEFIPKDWKVVNVPKSSYLLPQQTADASVGEDDFFLTQEAKFEEMSIKDGRHQGGKFTFYMMENRKPAKNIIESYAERERQSHDNIKEDGTYENGAYVNANPLSTYVVLRGTYYEYKSTGEIEKSADVRYTIHLGYVENVASDFNSNRNIFYTYHIKINGVQAIIDEVETSQPGSDKEFNEAQPGAEGDVVMSDQNLLLDAHYEVQRVVFEKSKLTNLSVAVKTPYEARTSADLLNGYYRVYEGDKGLNGEKGPKKEEGVLKDLEWVKFAKNTDASENYQSYRDVSESDLKNVKAVLNELYEHKDDKGNGNGFWTEFTDDKGNKAYKVAYTVFVNEFYYVTDPVTGNKANWKTFVNWENRQMHILCDTKFSFDNQSSLTKSNIMINQRPIRTIYNKTLSGLTSAWGIETISEDERMETDGLGSTFKTETRTNGRFNTLRWYRDMADKYWNTYVNFGTNRNKSIVKAQYACFQRNRDLNRNGKIDPYEIRWYLPATNQYVGLWIGQDALPSETRLLQATVSDIKDGSEENTTSNRQKYHLISSNNVRFWVEEGVSTGSETLLENKFNVRCARNVGDDVMYDYTNEQEQVPNNNSSGYQEPQDYVVPQKNDGIVTKIDLSRVDPNALRTGDKMYAEINFHSEHSGGELNYPYEKFEVKSSKDKPGQLSYEDNKLPTSSCPSGYRIPNQRELALICGYSDADKNLSGLGSCTYSDLSYKKNIIYTIARTTGLDSNFNYLTLSSKSTSKYRCVKDNY